MTMMMMAVAVMVMVDGNIHFTFHLSLQWTNAKQRRNAMAVGSFYGLHNSESFIYFSFDNFTTISLLDNIHVTHNNNDK